MTDAAHAHPLTGASPHAHARRSLGRVLEPAALLVAASALALALVPDETVLRTKVVIGRGTLLLAASTALLGHALLGRLGARWPGALALLAVLPAWAAVHVLLFPPTSRSLAWEEVERLLLVPLAAWTSGVTLARPRCRRWFLTALVLATVLVGAAALAQKLAGLLDLPIVRLARPIATFGNPVFLGAWLVSALPLALGVALFERGPRRWLAAIAAGLGLPALVATDSLGAWGGFVVALGVTALITIGVRRWVWIGGAAALAVVVAVGAQSYDRPRAHALIWRDSLALLAGHPHGVGPGQFPVAFPTVASPELLAVYPRSETIVNDAHCEPLQLLIELGAPGLIAALAAIVALALATRRTLRAVPVEHAERWTLIAAIGSIAGIAAQSLVSPDLRFVASAIGLGLLVGLVASFAPASELTLPGRRAGRVVVALLALAGLSETLAVTFEQLELGALARVTPAPRADVPPADLDAAWARARADFDDPQAHYDLGLALVSLHRYGEAASAFGRALALAPGHPGVIRSLGVAESLAGRLGPGLHHLLAALEADPGDDDVRYLAALTAYRSGDLAVAARQVEELLARNPQHVRGRMLRELLGE